MSMSREELIKNIFEKKSFLCVGLDTDINKLPKSFLKDEDPVFSFNKHIIDETKDYAIAYKINTAFYEVQGIKGWISMSKTLEYIPKNIFTIADAKRGDIGNTSEQYARTFFNTYPFDSVTVSPYMGADSVKPFLQFKNKWAIILGLTSNIGSMDFQLQCFGDEGLGQPVYDLVLETASKWGTEENTMFVIGATQDSLRSIRQEYPNHFFLVPGIGTQGGDLNSVCENGMNKDGGLLINISRAIIYSDNPKEIAMNYQKQMSNYF